MTSQIVEEQSMKDLIEKRMEDFDRKFPNLGVIVGLDNDGNKVNYEATDVVKSWIRSFASTLIEREREEIICAAIVDSNNRVFRGHRHHDAIHAMSTRPGTAQVVEEGFITSKNRFVGRREAMDIQIAAGKMAKSNKGVDLFSEDLY